jgi:5-methylcytosine-specific restriction endonuclease McrA
VREYRIRFDWSYARKEVYKRDKGCCQLCGLDCSKFFRKLKEAMKAFPKRERENRSKSFFLMNNVRYVKWTHRSTFWDVDHIVAWSQGGNFCGLNNLRLLCISCHQDETIRLIQRKKDAVNDPDPTRFL